MNDFLNHSFTSCLRTGYRKRDWRFFFLARNFFWCKIHVPDLHNNFLDFPGFYGPQEPHFKTPPGGEPANYVWWRHLVVIVSQAAVFPPRNSHNIKLND